MKVKLFLPSGTFQVTKKREQSLNLCSDKVTKRRVSITSFAPITTTKQTTTAAATAKPATTSTTTRSRNYYKVAIKDFRAKMQRNINPNFKSPKEKVEKKSFLPSARSSLLAPISKSPKFFESGNRSNSPASFPRIVKSTKKKLNFERKQKNRCSGTT